MIDTTRLSTTEKEVNGGGYTTRRQTSRLISSAMSNPKGKGGG